MRLKAMVLASASERAAQAVARARISRRAEQRVAIRVTGRSVVVRRHSRKVLRR